MLGVHGVVDGETAGSRRTRLDAREIPVESEQLFQKDAYLKSFEGSVYAVEGNSVALDKTIFYPGGGGQPHDTGTLVGEMDYAVLRVRRSGPEIWHDLDRSPPAAGTSVRGVLGWDRRYALMRTHTALHILCGVVWRDYGAKVTGANMQPLTGRMDFEFEEMHGDLVREIEKKINDEMEAARDVKVSFLDRETADRHPDLIRTKVNLLPEGIAKVRIVEIEGLDVQADGGTHVARTDEVGPIRIANYKSKGRANKRLEIVLQEPPSNGGAELG
jgi:misacylated tRNA(Ala) deacylase